VLLGRKLNRFTGSVCKLSHLGRDLFDAVELAERISTDIQEMKANSIAAVVIYDVIVLT